MKNRTLNFGFLGTLSEKSRDTSFYDKFQQKLSENHHKQNFAQNVSNEQKRIKIKVIDFFYKSICQSKSSDLIKTLDSQRIQTARKDRMLGNVCCILNENDLESIVCQCKYHGLQLHFIYIHTFI